jgi:hypothetical protein
VSEPRKTIPWVATAIYHEKQNHPIDVLDFVERAGQVIPLAGPDSDVPLSERLSCARLILEEALETIHSMGVAAEGKIYEHADPTGVMDLVKVADGLADLSVVTHGAAIRFGIHLAPVLAIVDQANLRKFSGDGHRDPSTGKWIKPSDFVGPEDEIRRELIRQKAMALKSVG